MQRQNYRSAPIREYLLPIAALIIIGSLVYAPNLKGPLFWDDVDWIVNNSFVHSISWSNVKFWFTHDVLAGVGLSSNYYRPVLFFTFAVNYLGSGINSFSYHLFSNAIHIANALLVFFLLLSLWKNRTVAFFSALLFLVHPLQTEAVAYISGRGDSLAVFLMLSAVLLHLRTSGSKSLVSWSRVSSLVLLTLAILSRETAIVFPFLVMLCEFTSLDSGRFWNMLKTSFIRALPYFGIVLVYGILRLTALNFQNTLNFYSEPNLYSEHILYRLLTFMHVLVDYLSLLLVPIGLHMERSMSVHTSIFQWPVWLGLIIIVGLVGLLYRLFVLKHPDFKIWLFGAGWFFVSLAPASGITPINAIIYEHWLYLPMIGFWFVFVTYAVRLFGLLPKKLARILLALPVAYMVFFAYQSVQRNILWASPVEFYKDILRYEPTSIRINNNLGNHYYNSKDFVRAEEYYRKATQDNTTYAQPYFNLGTILQSKGDIDGAIALYEQAIHIDPLFFYPYQQLAGIYAQQGDFSKVAENLEKLKELLPRNPRVYYNSALLFAALNDKEQAMRDIQRGLELSGSDPETARLLFELAQKISK